MKYHTYYYALLSGCLGASASCFAKLAFDTTTTLPTMDRSTVTTTTRSKSTIDVPNSYYYTINVCHYLVVGSTTSEATKETDKLSSKTDLKFYQSIWNDPYVACEWSKLILYRGMCIVGMIVCNIYMIGTFLKGIDESGTIAGTALSTSSNFIVSALYGYSIWEERYTIYWWFGFTMVCLGMIILTQLCSSKTNNQETTATKDHVKNE
jgi:hypothetical protein